MQTSPLSDAGVMMFIGKEEKQLSMALGREYEECPSALAPKVIRE
jgi:hypothetical protein